MSHFLKVHLWKWLVSISTVLFHRGEMFKVSFQDSTQNLKFFSLFLEPCYKSLFNYIILFIYWFYSFFIHTFVQFLVWVRNSSPTFFFLPLLFIYQNNLLSAFPHLQMVKSFTSLLHSHFFHPSAISILSLLTSMKCTANDLKLLRLLIPN